GRFIPLIPVFPVADCRGFCRLIPRTLGSAGLWSISGLHPMANSGTSANPRFTPPLLPLLPLDSIIFRRKKVGEQRETGLHVRRYEREEVSVASVEGRDGFPAARLADAPGRALSAGVPGAPGEGGELPRFLLHAR